MENGKTWFLVADASQAKLFSAYRARIIQSEDTELLELIAEYTHAASRKKNGDLVTDRQGDFGLGTFVEETPPKTHEAEMFALELIKYLETGRKDAQFRDIIIVAPPTFMGLLHKYMPPAMQKLILQTIEKDYTQLSKQALMQNLVQHF